MFKNKSTAQGECKIQLAQPKQTVGFTPVEERISRTKQFIFSPEKKETTAALKKKKRELGSEK